MHLETSGNPANDHKIYQIFASDGIRSLEPKVPISEGIQIYNTDATRKKYEKSTRVAIGC
jgi:hypothetical protein